MIGTAFFPSLWRLDASSRTRCCTGFFSSHRVAESHQSIDIIEGQHDAVQ